MISCGNNILAPLVIALNLIVCLCLLKSLVIFFVFVMEQTLRLNTVLFCVEFSFLEEWRTAFCTKIHYIQYALNNSICIHSYAYLWKSIERKLVNT